MQRLVRISTELLDDADLDFISPAGETIAGDVAAGRDERRQAQGYVAPVTAAAFLSLARDLRVETTTAAPAREPTTVAWSREAPPETTRHLAGGTQPRARLARIREQLHYLLVHEPGLHARRTEELAYLGNVLVSAASFNGRRFRALEAAQAASAACNLGLENWPRAWLEAGQSAPPADLLVRHDLATVFRVGWSVLHERVGLHTARTLVATLSRLDPGDGALCEQLGSLRDGLMGQLEAGTPWRELDNLDILLALDPPSWSVLVGLLDRCPAVPGATSSGVEFIAENRQIEWAHGFLRSLPERLADTGSRAPVARGKRRQR
jgi:hypothetical protein